MAAGLRAGRGRVPYDPLLELAQSRAGHTSKFSEAARRAIRGGASVMDNVSADDDADGASGDGNGTRNP